MTGALILGIALLIGGLLLANWFVNADLKSVIKAARWGAAILGVVLLIVLILTKAWQWLPFLGLVLIPWLRRFRMLARMAKSARGPSAGRRSSVDTEYLRMFLDHDSGDMEGAVRRGGFAGRIWSGCRPSILDQERPQPEQYHGTTGLRCLVSAASPLMTIPW